MTMTLEVTERTRPMVQMAGIAILHLSQSLLKIIDTSSSGGDTLWVSGYATYDALSGSFKELVLKLTGTYSQPELKERLDASSLEFYSGDRGPPDNVGDELTATHPIVRTNPVTGWNSLFALGSHFTKFRWAHRR